MQAIPCYYINLDRSAGRRAHMEDQFHRYKLNVERIAAVDGNALAPDAIPPMTYDALRRWRMSRPAIACLLSHRRVWKRIIASGVAYAAVFEDDILLSGHCRDLMTDSSWIPAGTDCIKLDTSEIVGFHSKPNPLPDLPFSLSVPMSDMRSTAGYLISRQRSSLLLELTQTITAPIDVAMFGIGAKGHLGLAYQQLHPAVCTQAQHGNAIGFLDPLAAESTITGPPLDARPLPQPKERVPLGLSKIRREIRRPIGQLAKMVAPFTDWFRVCLLHGARRMDVPFIEAD